MVCASQPLAAQAGLDILKRGGNAVDAAVATAACLTVMEPTSNGIGGDSFALIWKGGKLHGLNSGGPAPSGIDVEELRKKIVMPKYGWDAVNVPGAVAGWAELSKKLGKLPFEELLSPAIEYATEGFPVSPVISRLWDIALATYKEELHGEEFKAWFDTFAPNGCAPRAGELVRLPHHAATLRELADTKCESFYRGDIAKKIVACCERAGGAMRLADLEKYYPEWVTPISTGYKGYTVHQIPPNGHGIVALMALNIIEDMEIGSFGEADTLHKQIEAMKLAFADGHRYIADIAHMKVSIEQMLSRKYAESRRKLINEEALEPRHGDPQSHGTVYLCTADGEGNMVSYIQSNYMGFGSGIVIPNTGISMQNRSNNFSLDPASENCIAPNKKPYHTIIPGFLSKGGEAVGPFGVMGGFMQPQGHLQLVMNTVDFGMNPQEALDAPRWQWTGGKNIDLERGLGAIGEELIRRGHGVTIPVEPFGMGRGQIIWRNNDGILSGATEPRIDGTVAGY